MSQTIKLKKGFDINLAGKAANTTHNIDQPETFALKPTDFHGITRPKLLVKEGENVKAGTPIMYDAVMDSVVFTAPVSGEVVEVKRGAKRKLLEIRILADKEVEFEAYAKHSISDITSLSREEAVEKLTKGGAWPNLTQRPFGTIANPADKPKAIFVSGFDTHPLSPDLDYALTGEEQSFQAGLDVLRKLTDGKVHLNVNGDGEVLRIFSSVSGVEINKFSGPHPAGNVGVQIHHLDPINKGDIAWTCTPHGVVQIGKFFLEGKYDTSKLVALTGSSVKNTGYVKTYSGALIGKLVADNVEGDNNRFISGNVFTGESIGEEGYLGYQHTQVTIIPEGDEEEFLGWIKPTTKKLSFHKSLGLLSFLNGKKEFTVDTNTHGEERGFVMTGAFEKVMPMDVLPTYLFKAILANDYDEIEALGIFELLEEDVALCEFIDVSKNDLQHILREGIELIRNS